MHAGGPLIVLTMTSEKKVRVGFRLAPLPLQQPRECHRGTHSPCEQARLGAFAPTFAGEFGWLRSRPAASVKYTRYPSGQGNLRALASEPPSLCDRNAAQIRRTSHPTCHQRIRRLRSRPAASAKYTRVPIGPGRPPNFYLKTLINGPRRRAAKRPHCKTLPCCYEATLH